MKVVKAKIGQGRFVVNSKGKRVTPKYSFVSDYKYGPFYLVNCHDYWDAKRVKPDRMYIFDAESEAQIDIGYVTSHEKVNENIVAFKIDGMWHFYDAQRNLLRNDVRCFYKCRNHPYLIAAIGEKDYFLDENLKTITDPFISATDFDEFEYSVVSDVDPKKYSILSHEDGMFLMTPWRVECDELKSLSKDFLRIRRNGCYGIINKDGKEIVPAVYQSVGQRHNHFVICYNGKYGLTDANGKIIFDCFYDEIMETPDKFAVKDFTRLETSKTLEALKTE